MSARTASSAGRLAWMSEMSAYFILKLCCRRVVELERHHSCRRRTRRTEFLGRLHFVRHRFARDTRKAETREIRFGCRRQQIQREEPFRLRIGDRALDQTATDAMLPIFRRNRGRTEERVP